MQVIALIAAGASILASMPAVQGHGYIVEPAAQWTQGYASNGFGSTISSSVWGTIDNSKYGYGPNGTVNFFKAMLPTKGGGSLSTFIAKNQELYSDEVDPNCGLTAYKDSARSALPASQLTFTGFTHPGPCEVWCDDTKVLFDYDCQAKYPDIPATMPYDEAKCANANRLTIYWIAVQGDPWQVYTDCSWLEGGSGSGTAPSAGASTSTATTTAPSTSTTTTAPSTATTAEEVAGEASTTSAESESSSAATTPAVEVTEAPAAESEASSAATTPAVEETEAPSTEAPATDAPIAATDAPTADKCSRRRS